MVVKYEINRVRNKWKTLVNSLKINNVSIIFVTKDSKNSIACSQYTFPHKREHYNQILKFLSK